MFPAFLIGADSGGIPIVRIQNLNNPNSTFNYFTGEVSERNAINNGELLFSWLGSRGTSFGAHIWNGGNAVLNQHIFKVGFDANRATKMYLLHALNKAVTEVEENLHGGVGLVHITKGDLEKIEIPLPPLEVQKEIVAEIEGYQKVINGARAVLDNYRPYIPIHPDWPIVELGEVLTLQRGYDLPKQEWKEGGYPIVGSNGIIGFHNTYKEIGPGVVTGRSGTIGMVHYIAASHYWPHNTSLFVKGFKGNDPKFVLHLLESVDLKSLGERTAAVPSLDRKNAHRIKVKLPPIETQQAIVAEIKAEQVLVAANRELITRFEKKIQTALARVWGE
jgi:type I restriction enzyme M protein